MVIDFFGSLGTMCYKKKIDLSLMNLVFILFSLFKDKYISNIFITNVISSTQRIFYMNNNTCCSRYFQEKAATYILHNSLGKCQRYVLLLHTRKNQALWAWFWNSRCGGFLTQSRNQNHSLCAIVFDCVDCV